MLESKQWVTEVTAKRFRALLPSVLAITAALVGTLGALIASFVQKDQARRQDYVAIRASEYAHEQQTAESEKTRAQLTESMIATRALEQSIMEAARKKGVVQYSQGLSPSDRQSLDSVINGQADLDRRLASLEAALSQSPDKDVALPLMKQQITDMQDKNRGDIDNVHGEIGRLYTMMQWFLGLMVTLIIGVGGLIVNNLKQRTEKALPAVDASIKF